MKKIVHTDAAPAAIGPYSQANIANGMVYVSGQLGMDPATGELKEGLEAQAEQALNNLKAILEAAGSGLDEVVKTTVFLAKMTDFSIFNAVYAKYFPSDCPARSCFAVAGLPKGGLVEVEAIASVK
ncbi:MAG: RidA family protein [Clostridiales bacterium]|nr:RidA family protein [Clostridiales bacterium]